MEDSLKTFLVGVLLGGVIVGGIAAEAHNSSKKVSQQTHQLLCQGMSKSLRVYGMPRAEGVYLIVKFYKNKSTLSMVGPGCVILPEGEEE